MQLPRPSRSLAWHAFGALALCAACDGGGAPPASSASAPGSAPPVAGASAVASSPVPLDPRAPADAEVAAALRHVASCDSQLKNTDVLSCQEASEWERFLEARLVDDGLDRSRLRGAVAACLERLGDPSPALRDAAYGCVADHPDGVPDAKAMILATLDRMATERDASVRHSMWEVVEALDPNEHGLTGRVIEAVRATPTTDGLLFEAGVGALTTDPSGADPTPEAVTFALALVKEGRALAEATEILQRSALSPAEVCAAYVQVVESRTGRWSWGLAAMLETRGGCREHVARVVAAVVARGSGGSDVNTGIGVLAKGDLARFLESGMFDEAQAKAVRAAIEGAK